MHLSSTKLLMFSALVAAAACGSGKMSVNSGSAGSSGGHGGSSGSSTSGAGGLASGQCRSASDCMTGEFCGVTLLPPFCDGKCDDSFTGGCQSDADCQDAGTGLICGLPCECPRGGAQPLNHCTKGCSTAADCGPSMVCSSSQRCELSACQGDADCTANFHCTSHGVCAAKPCTNDGDCSGYCVLGACSPILGDCAEAVP